MNVEHWLEEAADDAEDVLVSVLCRRLRHPAFHQ
jgi:hypothetical protein